MNPRGFTTAILGLILLLFRSGQSVPLPETVDENDGLAGDAHNVNGDLQLNAAREDELLTGQRVANWTKDSGVNPEELGEYFEGDIRTIPSRKSRSATYNSSQLWPYGEVPYIIDSRFPDEDYNKILAIMEEFRRRTCINFVPYNRHRDYVYIQAEDSGCWSSGIGRMGRRQYINLQMPVCTYLKGTIIHELMHAIGFIHEHTREDRDNYVDILKENIIEDKEHNFEKAVYGTTTALNVRYDYDSVMHYSSDAFSSNGLPTILPNRERIQVSRLGQRKDFSKKDIVKINRLYNCNRRPTSPSSSHVAWPVS